MASLGKHCSRQEEIHDLLVARPRRQDVFASRRDPFLFGRGGEEAEYLRSMEFPSKCSEFLPACQRH